MTGTTGAAEHLLEYQDYLLAYRLRLAVGGRLAPPGPPLSLPSYARKRLERQERARAMVAARDYRPDLLAVERLTDELNFGFWHNPSESVGVLSAVIEAGGASALESEAHFVDELLTAEERAALSADERERIGRYYLGLLRASAAYLDAAVFTRLRAEVEPLRAELPLVVRSVGEG